MPKCAESPYNFLTDSMLLNPSDQHEAVAPLSQTSSDGRASPSPPLGVAGPSSSGAAGADPPFSTRPPPAVRASSGHGPGDACDEDEPPSDLLESEGQEDDADDWKDDGDRDQMTKIAMDLRKVDLASLRSENSTSKRCC